MSSSVVAISACAEDHDQASLHERAESAERALEHDDVMTVGEQQMKTKYTGKWLGACTK